jgi:hypothetical protein
VEGRDGQRRQQISDLHTASGDTLKKKVRIGPMQTQLSQTMARIIGVIALLSLAVQPACEFEFSTANIGSVTLSRDYQNGKIVDPTETFSPRNRTIHAVVEVNNAPAGTVVGANWIVLYGGKQEVVSRTIVLEGLHQKVVHFDLWNQRDWERGTYQVEITLDGKVKRTIDFRVV